MENPNRTNFVENGYWLSKQAMKYSTITPDVALFDWNAMFIFDSLV